MGSTLFRIKFSADVSHRGCNNGGKDDPEKKTRGDRKVDHGMVVMKSLAGG